MEVHIQRPKHQPSFSIAMERMWQWYKPTLSKMMEMEMATHSSILAWRILWTEKPGGLQSMESHRVGHD